MIQVYSIADNEIQKYGIVEVDSDGQIIGFKEKPEPSETSSRLACPCFYLFHPPAFPHIKEIIHYIDFEVPSIALNKISLLFRPFFQSLTQKRSILTHLPSTNLQTVASFNLIFPFKNRVSKPYTPPFTLFQFLTCPQL